ncbi:transcription factor FAMA-like isoform X1 [Populus nigra]|uniref:transcription factor FAMA-like isoform X1 n=1 Tax=Populus nigra TaxID=3691 RepID=UPI002B277E46|nr:transcription factor FAMA-like isoform X1 [Populus nigra]XP_061978643.1 transcription factor FAMA-like isoform X1 [Populus nigra]XP_061978650.1 transcription factor FAMA-like isoform X1 [Populus nigra]
MLLCSELNFSQGSFTELDYSLDHHHQQQDHLGLMKQRIGGTSGDDDCNNGMIDYMLNNPQQHQQQMSSGFCTSTSFDKLSFADVMQFADFGPKLALNQNKISEEETGIDPVYFLKFPVLNDKIEEQSIRVPQLGGENIEEMFTGVSSGENRAGMVGEERGIGEDEEARISDNNSVQLQFLGDQDLQNKNPIPEGKNKRKRPRTIKTSEEVESQRMTHIAVERNRRKQMNEHLRVLRSLMPGSYVQRGDQASIIGGAIEFVRELEQLLQCLESQKRRRLMDDSSLAIQQPAQPAFFSPMPLPNDQMKLVDFETGLREETAENKSCLADVEVKLLGFDAMIKILSRRRPGQLIKAIAALEDLQLNILHTNITTIDQTVLYSFNVKIASDSGFTAEDIASSVQQIFNFIHANSSI